MVDDIQPEWRILPAELEAHCWSPSRDWMAVYSTSRSQHGRRHHAHGAHLAEGAGGAQLGLNSGFDVLRNQFPPAKQRGRSQPFDTANRIEAIAEGSIRKENLLGEHPGESLATDQRVPLSARQSTVRLKVVNRAGPVDPRGGSTRRNLPRWGRYGRKNGVCRVAGSMNTNRVERREKISVVARARRPIIPAQSRNFG